MKILDILIVIFKYIPILLYLLIMRPYHIYTYYFNRPSYYKAGNRLARFYLWILRTKLSIAGAGLIPESQQEFMVVANHQSYVDIMIMLGIFPCAFIQRPIPYLPGFAWHFGKVSLVIEREHPISIIKAVKYVKRVVGGEGIPVVMFPEATRSLNGSLGKLNLGVATIAKTLKLAVLPVTICNSREILPKGGVNPKPGTVKVIIQPLIKEDFIKNHSIEEINQEMKRRLQKGLDDFDRAKRISP